MNAAVYSKWFYNQTARTWFGIEQFITVESALLYAYTSITMFIELPLSLSGVIPEQQQQQQQSQNEKWAEKATKCVQYKYPFVALE